MPAPIPDHHVEDHVEEADCALCGRRWASEGDAPSQPRHVAPKGTSLRSMPRGVLAQYGIASAG
jgi:hypothetical protein